MSKVKSFWTSDADIDNDMLSISDFNDDTEEFNSLPKPSIHLRKARAKPTLGNPSIYEDAFDYEENERTCRPIRGHPLLVGNYDLLPPGGTPSFLQQQYETSREIRQVSGLGFSNDLIEHSLRAPTIPDATKLERMSHIELGKSSRNSSKGTSPVSSPRRSIGSKESSPSSASEQSQRDTNKRATPSLYDMLKSKKEQCACAIERENVCESGDKPLNIHSKSEFPDLR